MNDESDGGGMPSADIVENNLSNEIFDDVSDINTITGNVTLRKIFLGIMTDNDEKLLASRFVFTDLPENENVSVFAFEATSWDDTRAQARDKIESYLAFGSKFPGHLLETQLEGQKVIQISLDKEDKLPVVGDALALVENEGLSTQFSQFVRITKVTSETRNFQVDKNTTVSRVIATVEISNALNRKYTGVSVPEYYTNASVGNRALVRETRVANAAKYYSASNLKEAAQFGDRKLQLDSVYVPIVPSTQSETPLGQIDPAGRRQTLIRGSEDSLVYTTFVNVRPGNDIALGSGVYPGTLSFELAGKTMRDQGGEIVDDLGTAYGSIRNGTGIISWYDIANFGNVNISFRFVPSTPLNNISQTAAQKVPKIGAGFNYIQTLPTEPSPGTLIVTYQVDGNVYTLVDDGSGNLSGDAGAGAGTITDKTVTITTGAIPDSESIIVYSYSEALNTFYYNNVGLDTFRLAIEVPDTTSLITSSISITWDGKTITANASGNLTGDGTGYYSYDDKTIYVNLPSPPPKGTEFVINYSKGKDGDAVSSFYGPERDFRQENMSTQDIAEGLEISIAGTKPIIPYQFRMMTIIDGINIRLVDDGNGNVIFKKGGSKKLSWTNMGASETIRTNHTEGDIMGTIDYANRKVVITQEFKFVNDIVSVSYGSSTAVYRSA